MAPVLPLPTLLSCRQRQTLPGGASTATNTAHVRRLQQSTAFVKSLHLQKYLHRHNGCVNTVSWSDDGSLLVSGSDDCDLNLWRAEEDLALAHNIHSGHSGNIFCAKFVPCMNNNLIVSCALDGNVRLTDVLRGGLHCIARYPQRVHKVAFLPQSPSVFLTAGGDGTVRLFDLRCDANRKVRATDSSNIVFDLRGRLRSNSIEVSAVSVHPLHGHLLAFAGGDEFVRVADLRRPASPSSAVGSTCVARFCPTHMLSEPAAGTFNSRHITGCQYDAFGRRIVATYSSDDIFVFDTSEVQPALPLNKGPEIASPDRPERSSFWKRPSEKEPEKESEEDALELPERLWFCRPRDQRDDTVGDDLDARRTAGALSHPILQRLSGHRNEDTVKEVTFYGVESEFVASGSDDGNIFVWDSHAGHLVTILREADSHTINCIAPNPHDVTIIATCGIDNDVKIWKPDGMRGGGLEGTEMERLVARNRQRHRMGVQRLSMRQVLQLILLHGDEGRGLLRLLGVDPSHDDDDEEEAPEHPHSPGGGEEEEGEGDEEEDSGAELEEDDDGGDWGEGEGGYEVMEEEEEDPAEAEAEDTDAATEDGEGETTAEGNGDAGEAVCEQLPGEVNGVQRNGGTDSE